LSEKVKKKRADTRNNINRLQTSINRNQTRLRSKISKLETANRVEAKLRADFKLESSRLMREVSDRIPSPRERLGKLGKAPDKTSIELKKKIDEVRQLRFDVNRLKDKIKSDQKKLKKAKKKLENLLKKK